LLVLYPFLFGMALYLAWKYYVRRNGPQNSGRKATRGNGRRGAARVKH
jgi:hypothetical protein